MFLHFEDWSHAAPALDEKGIRNCGRVIKVFGTLENPRVTLEKRGLAVVPGNSGGFDPKEKFEYPNRETYSGRMFTTDLGTLRLGRTGERTLRSLFRFAYEHGFNQAAMSERAGDGWLTQHPFYDVDGIEKASQDNRQAVNLHLDIFFPESLDALRDVVDFDNPAVLLNAREATRQRMQARGVDFRQTI